MGGAIPTSPASPRTAAASRPGCSSSRCPAARRMGTRTSPTRSRGARPRSSPSGRLMCRKRCRSFVSIRRGTRSRCWPRGFYGSAGRGAADRRVHGNVREDEHERDPPGAARRGRFAHGGPRLARRALRRVPRSRQRVDDAGAGGVAQGAARAARGGGRYRDHGSDEPRAADGPRARPFLRRRADRRDHARRAHRLPPDLRRLRRGKAALPGLSGARRGARLRRGQPRVGCARGRGARRRARRSLNRACRAEARAILARRRAHAAVQLREIVLDHTGARFVCVVASEGRRATAACG